MSSSNRLVQKACDNHDMYEGIVNEGRNKKKKLLVILLVRDASCSVS